MDMYSILRIQYVHITPDSIVQYTPKYSSIDMVKSKSTLITMDEETRFR